MTVTNPVTIPEYSVTRLEWTVFAVPRPTLGVTVQSDANSSRATMSLCFQLATLYQAGQPAAEASGIPTDFER